jgi:hypothetical protein
VKIRIGATTTCLCRQAGTKKRNKEVMKINVDFFEKK